MKRFALVTAVVSQLLGAQAFADQSFDIHDVAEGRNPAIAVDNSGQLHLVLETQKDSNSVDVVYTKSVDGARSWSSAADISGAGQSSIADIVVDTSGIIDAAWGYTSSSKKTAGIFLARSLDEGKTWTEPINISNTPGASSEPDVAVGPDNAIHVTWTDTSTGENHPQIYYCFSNNSGGTWSKAENISNSLGSAHEPAIAVGKEGVVYLAWSETAAGADHSDIYFARKTSSGWSKPINVSNSSYAVSHPDVACGVRDNVHLCWAENSGENNAQDICYRAGNSRGQFRRALNLSDIEGVSRDPALVADDLGRVAVVWSHNVSGGSKSEILGRASLDDGKQFSPVVSFSNKEAISIHPDVDIAGSQVFVVWEDFSPIKSAVKSTFVEIEAAPTVAP